MNQSENLDPKDWDEMKKLAHVMIDDAFSYLQNRREDPVWRQMPEEIRKNFKSSIPRAPTSPNEVYDSFKADVLPYPMGNTHPRFWAWYMGNGTVMGALGDFLTSIISPNAGAGNHVGQELEDQVIEWMKEIMEYPKDASGILVSGGSMANFVGLAVARNQKAGFDVRQEGLSNKAPMAVYASTEVHSCNQKAIELLGLGAEYLRKIPVNHDFTINIEILKNQIEKDKVNGILPLCIIANAGTVNTGAIDDLSSIEEICRQENLWFHVDGAIGALAVLSPLAKEKLKGIEKSDSVAMDLHKWLHVPFEAACVLVRNRESHRSTFALTPEYLMQYEKGLASGKNWYSEYGLQLSRRLNALKIWMSIKEHGIEKYGRMISKNINQAYYLKSLVDQGNHLELMAPVGMDIVCYRYNPGKLSVEQLNQLNTKILIEMHESGVAVPSYTTLRGNYCIRVAIANHRSINSDFDLLIRKTLEFGEKFNTFV